MTVSIKPGIFKAYDVRGLYPGEVNEETARAIGTAFAAYLQASRIGVGRDMRLSSPALAAAFIDGVTAQGAEVVDYGMIPTDVLYYAVARDRLDGGVEVTASHNPKDYNGLKMVRVGAFPLIGEAGISDIRDMILAGRLPSPAPRRGPVTTGDVVDAYVDHVMSFIDPRRIKPFRVVLDAGSGMAGLIAPKLFDRLPCQTTKLCFTIDGRFPSHEANPLRKPF
jgi:phosphomannomutase